MSRKNTRWHRTSSCTLDVMMLRAKLYVNENFRSSNLRFDVIGRNARGDYEAHKMIYGSLIVVG